MNPSLSQTKIQLSVCHLSPDVIHHNIKFFFTYLGADFIDHINI